MHACRVLRKVPDMLESFVEKAPGLLEDRTHSVLLAGVSLMLDICAMEPSAIEVYRAHVPLLCRVLRSLIMGGFAPGALLLVALMLVLLGTGFVGQQLLLYCEIELCARCQSLGSKPACQLSQAVLTTNQLASVCT